MKTKFVSFSFETFSIKLISINYFSTIQKSLTVWNMNNSWTNPSPSLIRQSTVRLQALAYVSTTVSYSVINYIYQNIAASSDFHGKIWNNSVALTGTGAVTGIFSPIFQPITLAVINSFRNICNNHLWFSLDWVELQWIRH